MSGAKNNLNTVFHDIQLTGYKCWVVLKLKRLILKHVFCCIIYLRVSYCIPRISFPNILWKAAQDMRTSLSLCIRLLAMIFKGDLCLNLLVKPYMISLNSADLSSAKFAKFENTKQIWMKKRNIWILFILELQLTKFCFPSLFITDIF